MSESHANNERRIAGLERRARWLRAAALAWGAWTAVSFGYLGFFKPANYSAEEGWPIYVGGAILSLLFLATVAWRPWHDVREWIDRVTTLLQWQVAAGAVIAFSIAVSARPELFLPFGIYGLFLLLTAVPAMAMRIVSGTLQMRYRERDEARELERRTAETRALILAIRAEVRPRRCGSLWRR